jgi:hypothetical protein
MKKNSNYFKNAIYSLMSFVYILSPVGIIVFGLMGNLSMFLLSTSLIIFVWPWFKDNINKEKETSNNDVKPKKDNFDIIMDKVVSKFTLPFLFVCWLFLLNKCVNLPTIELYAQIIWAVIYLTILAIPIYQGIKEGTKEA